MEIVSVFAHNTSFVVLKYGHVSRDGHNQYQNDLTSTCMLK